MSLTSLEGSLHRGCGGHFTAHEETVTVRLSGMATQVTRGFFRCDKCAHEQRTIEQRDRAEQEAIQHIRERHELLSPKEIRRLRESLGLTPEQMADLCYGTPKGIVVGWEKGRYLQNREADALLRSLLDPEVLQARAARAGVELPAAALETDGVPAGDSSPPATHDGG